MQLVAQRLKPVQLSQTRSQLASIHLQFVRKFGQFA
jgi:hypothetical protein